ncbi:alpha/beta hydrolase [Virgisporangium aliadipatigenens]|uniref:Alpha/beta hydrolase n=1 Tax=Virgisporangium aliadipatigenens TaxID=741659 RepID=A0A8J3YM29_9ACTN|nr:alpha/beta fold hydrolase [Virgisporangium aliadipatigenens]GIJ46892.1 alpha/beta hydrolase [Virgisporangium aliadipatigenens]
MNDTRTFTSHDGLDIAYRVWGEQHGGVPVVLHHGFVADGIVNWAAPGVVDALVATGRHVVAIDARGHGASAKPTDVTAYGEPNMSRDVSTLIDELGVDEVDLVGYSMGAIVTAITLTREPRVRRAVIAGVGAGVVELGGLDTRAVAPELVAAALTAEDPAEIAASPAAPFRELADAIGADRHALARQVHAAHQAPIALDTITAPVLVLAGRDDPLAARPEVLAAAIPEARLTVVDGDHATAVGEPAFARAITWWVNGADLADAPGAARDTAPAT